MTTMTAAAFVLATDTLCAAIGETPDACRESMERAPDDVRALFAGEEPRLALLDATDSPRTWQPVDGFYRIRRAGKRHADADAYHVGDVVFYADEDEAIRDAESLDGVGYDCEVVAFDRPAGDSGRVVWGA